MCQPSPKNWVFGFFRLGLDLGPVGTGDWGLGLGLDKYYILFPGISARLHFTLTADSIAETLWKETGSYISPYYISYNNTGIGKSNEYTYTFFVVANFIYINHNFHLEEVFSDLRLCVCTLCNRALRMALKEYMQHSKESRGGLRQASR